MKKYRIVLRSDVQDFLWLIYETQTEQYIASFFFVEDAQDYMRFLNSGGAFDGFTPSFVLTPFKIPETLDVAVARLLD